MLSVLVALLAVSVFSLGNVNLYDEVRMVEFNSIETGI